MKELRYSRLNRFAGLSDTLSRWQESSCAVVGLGGLGGPLVQHLARFGVARLVLIDHDLAGPENLGHQSLVTEDAALHALPKAILAARAVGKINTDVHLEPLIAELNRENIAELLDGAELIFDATDNFYVRFLLNDYSFKFGVPLFYAGVVRGEATVRAIIPGVTGCLRCLLDTPPPPGEIPICAEEGVYPPVLPMAAALQLDTANRYLAGTFTSADDQLYSVNSSTWRITKLQLSRRDDCPCCAKGNYDYLDGTLDHLVAQNCVNRVLEIQYDHPLDLDQLEARLRLEGQHRLIRNSYCLMAEEGEQRFVLFPSGKIMLSGSSEPTVLNRFAATYLGM